MTLTNVLETFPNAPRIAQIQLAVISASVFRGSNSKMNTVALMLMSVKYAMADVSTTATILREVSAVHVNLDLDLLVKPV